MSAARRAGLAESAAATMPQPCFETRVRDGFVEVRWRPETGLAAA